MLIGIKVEQLYLVAANILTISVFDALSIGGGPVAAVLLCVKRERVEVCSQNNLEKSTHQILLDIIACEEGQAIAHEIFILLNQYQNFKHEEKTQ